MDAHETQVLAALTRAKKRAAFQVVGREGALAPRKSTHAFGGLVTTPGTWLYGQFPGSPSPDAIQLVEKHDTSWKALRHGGVTPYTINESRLHDLKSPLTPGNYLKQLGYLEQVIPDAAQRAAFVERAQQTPVREAEEKRRQEEEKRALLSRHGPWFADVARSEGNLGNVGAAWVLKKVLKKHGITVRTGQRHYSMASGMDFHHEKGDREKINRIFPGLAGRSDSAHPFATEDRSDPMTDYYSPGGFHVAPAYVEEVRKAIREELGKEAKKAKTAPPEPTTVYERDWRPEDVLVVGDGSKLWVYDLAVGRKSRDAIGTSMPFRGVRVFDGKGVDTVQAPDLTFKKLKERGSKVLLSYMPSLKGRRVLLRGVGWYQAGPTGKYENYAYDVT